MNRTHLRVLVAAVFGLILIALGTWDGRAQQPAQQQPAGAATDANFTGKTTNLDASNIRTTRRRFEAGSRAAWHSHAGGQLLFVEEGRARVQRKGQLMKEFGVHETDYTPPNVVHWHGAAPNEALVQTAVSMGDTKWLEKVTDREYSGLAK